MTYYYAESPVAGPNEQKLVIEVWTTPDVNAINWDTNTVQIRALARTHQAKFSGDNQTFNRSGSWSGSTNYYMPATANTWVTLADQTWNVSTQQGSGVHLDIDGSITGHYNGASFSTGVNVDIAARPYPASQPTLSANNFNMGTTVTINTNRLNSSFTHNLYFFVGGTEVHRITGVGASTTWNFPIATLGPYAPSSTALAGIIYCDTMNGGSLVGSSSVGWTANVPTSVVPSITAANVSDGNATVVSNVAQYVKLLSKLKVQLTGCAGAYGSSIAKHEVTVSGKTYDITNLSSAGASSLLYTFTTAIMSSGTVDVIGKVTDSRGRAATKTTSITVLDYSLPNPTGFVVQRCDSAGTLNTLGTYVKVTTQGTTKSLVNSTERNNLAYQVDYRQVGTTPWLALKAKTTQAALTLDLTQTLGTGQFSPVNSYEFKFTLYDKFNNVAITTTTGTSEVTLSLNKTGIGIGKVWQQGSIDAKGDIFTEGGFYSSNNLIPSGANLNNYINTATYVQTTNASAALGSNYPEPLAGFLEVSSSVSKDLVLQKYTVHNSFRTYVRKLQSAVWGAWELVSAPKVFGVMYKTNGFQASTTTEAAVVLNHTDAILRGGVTTIADNGGSFVIPKTALYRVITRTYVSGGGTGSYTFTPRRLVGSTWYQLGSTRLEHLYGANDDCTSSTVYASLNAGDKISLWFAGQGASVWGSSEKQGASLTIEEV